MVNAGAFAFPESPVIPTVSHEPMPSEASITLPLPIVDLANIRNGVVASAGVLRAVLIRGLADALAVRVDCSGSAGAALSCYQHALQAYASVYGANSPVSVDIHLRIGELCCVCERVGVPHLLKLTHPPALIYTQSRSHQLSSCT